MYMCMNQSVNRTVWPCGRLTDSSSCRCNRRTSNIVGHTENHTKNLAHRRIADNNTLYARMERHQIPSSGPQSCSISSSCVMSDARSLFSAPATSLSTANRDCVSLSSVPSSESTMRRPILGRNLNPCPLPDVAKCKVGSPGKGPMTQFPSGESVYQHILVEAHGFSARSGYTFLSCSLNSRRAGRGTRMPSPK